MVARWLWLLLGCVSTGFGIAGAVLPLVPATPFLLLAAFAFARSSPRFHDWLINHRHFGPVILDWQRNRSIRRRFKMVSLAAMGAALALAWLAGVAAWALALQAVVLTGVAIFILSRPDGSEPDTSSVARSRRSAP